MRNAKQQLVGWALIGFVAVLALCAGGLIVLKVLPPRDQSRIMLHLPAPVRLAVNNLLFPHPDSVPTPSGPVKNISLLLTPLATHAATSAATRTATLPPRLRRSHLRRFLQSHQRMFPPSRRLRHRLVLLKTRSRSPSSTRPVPRKPRAARRPLTWASTCC